MREGPATTAEWARFARELALNLQRHRHAANLTQEQVAERAGISLYAYQTYERGTAQGQPVNPRLATVLAVAEALDVSVEKLLPSPPRLTMIAGR
ncbi:helix-turn-helix domain-containing protein [Microbacterium sp. ASV81]|uniref:helix-turn-helix domain-containing protein n=1 Tax=Microbacterium capsulatum TaxID=3041921 RepID=UPI0035A3ACF4